VVRCAAGNGDGGKVNVLVIGTGGREHSIAWKLAQSARCETLYCAPGNAGISLEENIVTVAELKVEDHAAVIKFCQDKDIGLVVIGPEAPLVAGLADDLGGAGIPTFGPSKGAAELEGSKAFMKDLCAKYNIPTAGYARFTEPAPAKEYVRAQGAPIVVKTDGLAAGKGVILCSTVLEAEAAIDLMLVEQGFGAAGGEIVIEEFLTGEEASFFALLDGEDAIPLMSAQDHKAVGDGDTGPNTGGMGAYSPAPVVTPEITQTVMETIVLPTARGMVAEGRPFRGVLFAGLMIEDGEVKLLEHNVRFGDPECQGLMMRLESDLLEVLIAACSGKLDTVKDLKWSEQTVLTVVMAANGYPGSYTKGTAIRGLDKATTAKVFHAGTAWDGDDIVAVGGRVLGVTALGDDVLDAQTKAYQAVDAIDWPEGFCRRDIGWRAVARLKAAK